MLAKQLIVAALVAAVSANAAASEDALFAKLLKRQEPGTPAYNCHDVCGAAISQSKRPSPCESDAFKTNYENCLTCSGPDNYNIWRYYGNTLSTAGKTCGLETEPKSGKQPDVGPAVQAGSSSSAAASATGTAAPTEATSAAASIAVSVTAAPSASPSVSGSPTASANSTASFTSSAPIQLSTNAAPTFGAVDTARLLGAVVMGAVFM